MPRGFRLGTYVSSASSDTTVVAYYVDTNEVHYEEFANGYDVLTPSGFTPAKTGYSFVGWRMDNIASSDVLVSKIATGGLVRLYAVFSKAITVTYYDNSTTASTTSRNLYYNNSNVLGATFTLYQSSTVDIWYPRGWTKSSSSGSATIAHEDSQPFTITADETLYGCYQKTVYVFYNANGGSGTMPDSTGTAYLHSTAGTEDASIILSDCTYTRESPYIFTSWLLNSTSGTSYAAGSTYSSTDSAMMYAAWSVPQPEAFEYTGTIVTYIVYPGVTYKFKCWGAQGGNARNTSEVWGFGARGAYAEGTYTTNETKTLYICVGGAGGDSDMGWNGAGYSGAAGYNGGGAGASSFGNNYARSCAGAGGGASSISTVEGGASVADIIVAGGGAGSGCGADGTNYPRTSGNTAASSNGTRGQGNNGAAYYWNIQGYSLAGGGGYYGGSSSYTGTNYTGGVTNASTSQGQRSGNGKIEIEVVI